MSFYANRFAQGLGFGFMGLGLEMTSQSTCPTWSMLRDHPQGNRRYCIHVEGLGFGLMGLGSTVEDGESEHKSNMEDSEGYHPQETT